MRGFTPDIRRGAMVAVLLSFMIGGLCWAAETAQDPSELLTVLGKIAAVDWPNKLVTVDKGPGALVTTERLQLRVNGETVMTKAGVRLQVTDLGPSEERVTIHYVPQGSQLMARSITFEKPAGLKQVAGTIESVNLLKGELVLRSDSLLSQGKPRTLFVTERTILTQGGARTYLAKARPGDAASIEFLIEEDRPVIYAMAVTTSHKNPVFDRGGPWSGAPRPASGLSGSSPSNAQP